MRALKEGDKIFTEVSKTVSWEVTRSQDEAAKFLENLRIETEGLVIVDFLDAGNWDRIDGIESDLENGFLKIHWHDYRHSNETHEEKVLRKQFFPADLTSLLIKFKEFRILKIKTYPAFILRGFAIKDKEVEKYLVTGKEEFKIFDRKNNFSKLGVKNSGHEFESHYYLNNPIFSMIIIPKNINVSSHFSRNALLSYNLTDSIDRLNKVKEVLLNVDLVDEDLICEKANSIRRIFEFILKVEICYRNKQLNVTKDYSELKLGDLTGLIKAYIDLDIYEILRKITVGSNELSHESGKPINRKKVLDLCYLTLIYSHFLLGVMSLDPYPVGNQSI